MIQAAIKSFRGNHLLHLGTCIKQTFVVKSMFMFISDFDILQIMQDFNDNIKAYYSDDNTCVRLFG